MLRGMNGPTPTDLVDQLVERCDVALSLGTLPTTGLP